MLSCSYHLLVGYSQDVGALVLFYPSELLVLFNRAITNVQRAILTLVQEVILSHVLPSRHHLHYVLFLVARAERGRVQIANKFCGSHSCAAVKPALHRLCVSVAVCHDRSQSSFLVAILPRASDVNKLIAFKGTVIRTGHPKELEVLPFLVFHCLLCPHRLIGIGEAPLSVYQMPIRIR